MRSFAILTSHPPVDASVCISESVKRIEINTFIFQGAPQSLDEHMINPLVFAIYGYFNTSASMPIHDRNERQKSMAHRYVCHISMPNPISPGHRKVPATSTDGFVRPITSIFVRRQGRQIGFSL
jgi:hypothetical protein